MIDKNLEELSKDLYEFIKNKYKFDKDPIIKFRHDTANAKKILGKTGYYDPNRQEIIIYCSNRHSKDILRSLAHELMHHVQNCNGMMHEKSTEGAVDSNYVLYDEHLRELEEHAFTEGNLSLREWEAHKKMSDKNNVLHESKNKSTQEEQVEGGLNPALRDSVVYRPEDRSCNDLYSQRETAIFQELLKKFGIKK